MGSSVRLASAMDRAGNVLRLVDINSQETVVRNTAATLDEDFLGAGHWAAFPTSATTGYPWVAKITGTATVGVIANFPGGAAACTLNATSSAEEAVLYSGDQLHW